MMTETAVVQIDPKTNAPKPEARHTPANNNRQANGVNGGGALDWIRYNKEYFFTVPGLIKVAQLIIGLICIIFTSAPQFGSSEFFVFITIICFIITLLWVFIYFLGVREAMQNIQINWLLTELANTTIIAVLYLIASIFQLVAWSPPIFGHKSANTFAGIMGIVNAAVYGAGAYFLHLDWQGSADNAGA